ALPVRRIFCAFLATLGFACGAQADGQMDPELKSVVAKAIAEGECFTDKYDAEVWYKLMEPRLRGYVKDQKERMEILRHVYCEARAHELPAELVLAVIDVESAFNIWAVSSAGAQGLMQVMPFWPEQLGMKRHQLMKVQPNIRMGCAILRHYYQRERKDVRRALARYNGSIGRREYPDKVIGRWTTKWRA
ncbi:MAG TPA: lytic transglycosylase domain-containing protein, partial [Polyangiales bacterium]